MNLETLKIKLDKLINKKFVRYWDVIPKNEIDFKYFPCALIVNSSSDLPGSHWLAFYANSCKKIYFFDSLGNLPSKYGFPDLSYKIENHKQLQNSESSICGIWVLLYIYFKTRGYSISKLLKRFTSNHSRNDAYVTRVINKLLS